MLRSLRYLALLPIGILFAFLVELFYWLEGPGMYGTGRLSSRWPVAVDRIEYLLVRGCELTQRPNGRLADGSVFGFLFSRRS